MKIFFSTIPDSLQIERRRLCFSCNKNCSMVWDGFIFAAAFPSFLASLSLSLSRSLSLSLSLALGSFWSVSPLSFPFLSLCVFSLFFPFNITSHVVHPKCSLTFLSAAPLGVSEWILCVCVCVCVCVCSWHFFMWTWLKTEVSLGLSVFSWSQWLNQRHNSWIISPCTHFGNK